MPLLRTLALAATALALAVWTWGFAGRGGSTRPPLAAPTAAPQPNASAVPGGASLSFALSDPDADHFHALYALLSAADETPLRVLLERQAYDPENLMQSVGDALLGESRKRTPEVQIATTYLMQRRDRLKTTVQCLLHLRCAENRTIVERALAQQSLADRERALVALARKGAVCVFDKKTPFVLTAQGGVACPRNGRPPHVETSDRGVWSILTGQLFPRENDLEMLDRLAPLRQDSVVVDLGCGLGSYTLPISRKLGARGRVYALDVDREAVAFVKYRAAQEKADNVSPRESGADDAGLSPESVDVVLIVDVHLYDLTSPGNTRQRLFSGLHRALRKGGRLLIMNHTSFQPPEGWYETHLGAAGFRFARTEESVCRISPTGRRKHWLFLR